MAKYKYSQDEVVEGLMEVFRRVGYDGASLEELAKATGLKKSSLYHRFPKGKRQMAAEVLRFAGQWVKENITDILKRDSDPQQRLKLALRGIDKLYSGGRSACLLRALSLDTGMDLLSRLINDAFDDLIQGFSKLARDQGYTKEESIHLAEDVIIRIQGALIVGRGTGDEKIFRRILEKTQELFGKRE